MRRSLDRFVLLVCLLSAAGFATPAQAQGAPGVVQALFEGDRTCGDNPTDCPFAATTATQRYLHVVVHDSPGDANWGVWVGATCATSDVEAEGAHPVTDTGFVEVVVDLAPGPGRNWMNTPLCFLFRGGFGKTSTYYAAYFDGSAVPDAQVVLPNYEHMGGRVDLSDLDVAYIHRDPTYPYDATPNAPQVGQAVTYTAHVVNQGGRPLTSFDYHWLIDGKDVQAGRHDALVSAFGAADISLQLPWSLTGHRITFWATTTDRELSAGNNELTVDTNAISLGFWVEQSAYEYFRAYQQRYCAEQGCSGSDSLDDWLQRQVQAWNRLFRQATYRGLTPRGVSTRVRVDKVVVVPDSALPLHGGIASDAPDRQDRSVDLEWGLPSRGVATAYPLDGPGPFRLDWALLHELGHARSLADFYRFDIPQSGDSRIDVKSVDGRLAYDPDNPYGVANPIRAFAGSDGGILVYQNMERDLMSCVCAGFYSAYSALVLNRLGDRRALCGNINPPCNIGDWYLNMPPKIQIRVRSGNGREPAGPLTVRLFYDSGVGYGTHRFTQSDSKIVHGSDGVVDLPSDPFHAGGSADRAGHNLLLIEAGTGRVDRFCFLEPTDFNLAYWEGYVDAAHPAVFTLRLNRIWQNACRLVPPPALVNEPFATSVAASSVSIGTGAAGAGGHRRTVTVRLRDSAGVPMRHRQLHILDYRQRVVAFAATAGDGTASATVPIAVRAVTVDDVTDNHLMLGPVSPAPLRKAVRPR